MNNNQKVIIVSGGGKGLGSGIVSHLLEAGYRVESFGRSKTEFVTSLEEGEFKERFSWSTLDLQSADKIETYYKYIRSKYNSIYGIVNNAAIAVDGLITLMSEASVIDLLNINLVNTILFTRQFIKPMLLANQGVIINISSIIGSRGYSGLAAYSASKAGLDGFTRSLARELGPVGIRCNSVAPGYLETHMSDTLSSGQRKQIIRRTPLQRLGKVDDIVPLIEFLLSDNASFITGQTITVDGGITC